MLKDVLFAVAILLGAIMPMGCRWQANNASQAIEFDPGAIGSGQQVVRPANDFGYSNGQGMDMRSKH